MGYPWPHGPEGSEQTFFLKTAEAATPDDDVIQYLDAEESACIPEPDGDLPVFTGWGWIAAGVLCGVRDYADLPCSARQDGAVSADLAHLGGPPTRHNTSFSVLSWKGGVSCCCEAGPRSGRS